jgi:membrane-associated phospholipid phosphatase
VSRANLIARFDDRVADAIQAWRGSVDGAMLLVTTGGYEVSMAAVTAAVVATLAARRRPREALFMLLSAGGALALNPLVRRAIGRQRPRGRRYLVEMPRSASFPSGHSMGTAATLLSLVVVSRPLMPSRRLRSSILLGGALATLGTGLSRVYFGVHYPSDVIGGQVTAGAWVLAMRRWLLPAAEGQRPQAEPEPAHHRSATFSDGAGPVVALR